jgi:hypothetical protein
MNDINELVIQNTADISGLKVDVNSMKTKIDDLSTMKDAVIRLTTLQEKQAERDAKFDSIYEEQIKINVETKIVLKNINENLVTMNVELKETNTQVISLKNDVANLKDKKEEKLEDKKINTQIKLGKINSKSVLIASIITSGLALIGTILILIL